jgi:FixJ family two-component response regulator
MLAGFKVLTFDRPTTVLATNIPKTGACLVVDFHLPEMNGVELCDALAASGKKMTTIFITGDYEQMRSLIARSPRSIVLSKPVRRKDLLAALSTCFASE